ncbi:hypothetical protein GCM10017635_28990 [Paracoccus kondratievae]|uniref:Uncharacterized protein n=1 Tax=Paracoccus kondratievae TaxID=135740 RepID=A0AAD3P0U8_9RHOB|nr:hypothetical protein GCM10017635_28990 [Paracoccus kondratievae]
MDKWSHTLVSNSEWSELVAIYMHSDRHRLWYDSGHADGRQEALKDVSQIISATSEMVSEGEARNILKSLASIITLLALDAKSDLNILS